MFHRKPLEERLAERQAAQMRSLQEGKHFEHGPARFVFITLIAILVIVHTVGLAVVMHYTS